MACGTALLVPALIYATHTGGFPPTTEESVLGTGLNPGALGVALDVAGFATVFAGFVFETPLPSAGVGLAVVGVLYLLASRVLPERTTEDVPETAVSDTDTGGVYGAVAGILAYSGLNAWSQSRIAALVVLGIATVLVGIGARKEGYI